MNVEKCGGSAGAAQTQGTATKDGQAAGDERNATNSRLRIADMAPSRHLGDDAAVSAGAEDHGAGSHRGLLHGGVIDRGGGSRPSAARADFAVRHSHPVSG